MCLLDEGEVCPHIMGLTTEAVKTGGVTKADKLVKPRRFLHIGRGAVSGETIPDQFKISREFERLELSISSRDLSRTQR